MLAHTCDKNCCMRIHICVCIMQNIRTLTASSDVVWEQMDSNFASLSLNFIDHVHVCIYACAHMYRHTYIHTYIQSTIILSKPTASASEWEQKTWNCLHRHLECRWGIWCETRVAVCICILMRLYSIHLPGYICMSIFIYVCACICMYGPAICRWYVGMWKFE